MTFKSDPPRLKHAASGSSEAARALLDRSRGEVPDAAAIARLASRLPLAPPPGGGATATGAPSGAAATASGASVATSVVVGAVLAIGVLGGAWWQGGARHATSAAPREPAAAIAAPRPTTSPIDTAIAAPPEAPTAAPVTEPAPASAAPAASAAPSPREQPAAIPGSPAPSLGASAPAPAAVESEVELLSRARASLRSDPARALAAAEEHRARFAGGMLAQEREVLAISALIALGRRADARARATRFVASYPRSVHRASIEAMTDLQPNP